MHWLNRHLPAPLVSEECFFGRFLLRLSRIKSSQHISVGKSGPTALNFGYDFFFLYLFWDNLYVDNGAVRLISKSNKIHEIMGNHEIHEIRAVRLISK